jgi:acetyl-CoA carboxylase alpha subunit
LEKERKADDVASAVQARNLVTENFVDVIATEMADGVERAVEYWMLKVEQAMSDTRLTSLGRLNAVGDIIRHYKKVTGRTLLKGRKDSARHEF